MTIFVMPIRPTFWLKEVFGSTPNREAKEEPRPSQMTEPESSLSVASLPRPPSQIPESAGPADHQDRRQVSDEHGQHMLHAEKESFSEGDPSFQEKCPAS